MHTRRWIRGFGLLVVLALVLAACGAGSSNSSSSTSGGGTTTTSPNAGNPPPAPGFDGKTIHLGALTALTGIASVIALPLTNGNKVWFDALNAQGGIAGKYKVVVDSEDTQYVPQVAAQKYDALKDKVVAFVQLFGTDPTKAVLPKMERDKKVGSPATLDAEWIQDQNLLPLSAPYQVQMINGADWYVKDGGGQGKTACAMIQNDSYGAAGLQGVQAAAKAEGFSVDTVAKYTLNASDVTPQVQQLVDGKCQVVYLTSLATDTQKILGKAQQLGFSPTWILQSPAWLGLFASGDLLPYLEQHVYVLAAGPAWGDTSVPGMKQMLDAVKKYSPKQGPDFYFAYGYNQGRVLTALLEKAVQLGDLSAQGVYNASLQMGTVNFDGLDGPYTYGPVDQREPSHNTSIYKVKGGAPFGLQMVKQDYVSATAKSYSFTG